MRLRGQGNHVLLAIIAIFVTLVSKTVENGTPPNAPEKKESLQDLIKPIIPTFRQSDAPVNKTRLPPNSQVNGDPCDYHDDCKSNCCLFFKFTNWRFCSPKPVFGQRCSKEQIVGGASISHCNCAMGSCHYLTKYVGTCTTENNTNIPHFVRPQLVDTPELKAVPEWHARILPTKINRDDEVEDTDGGSEYEDAPSDPDEYSDDGNSTPTDATTIAPVVTTVSIINKKNTLHILVQLRQEALKQKIQVLNELKSGLQKQLSKLLKANKLNGTSEDDQKQILTDLTDLDKVLESPEIETLKWPSEIDKEHNIQSWPTDDEHEELRTSENKTMNEILKVLLEYSKVAKKSSKIPGQTKTSVNAATQQQLINKMVKKIKQKQNDSTRGENMQNHPPSKKTLFNPKRKTTKKTGKALLNANTKGHRRAESKKKNGAECTVFSDCKSSCCLIYKNTNMRFCSPKPLLGQRCSTEKIEGTASVGFCDCIEGVCKFDMKSGRAAGTCVANLEQQVLTHILAP